MKTLVIHPYDTSTSFLEDIYSDKDYTIIDTNVSHKTLKNAIKDHDKIIMLGHGCEKGLFGFGRLVINSTLVYLLREKYCVCIWCNADMFVEKYKLNGLYTGMIISEKEEAIMYCVNSSNMEILQSNTKFSNTIKNYIDSCEDVSYLIKNMYSNCETENPVITFNVNNIYHTLSKK